MSLKTTVLKAKYREALIDGSESLQQYVRVYQIYPDIRGYCYESEVFIQLGSF